MTAKLDASATIYLGKANLLALAAQVCGGLAITTGVYEEVVVRGQEVGHRDAETIAKAVQDQLVEVISLTEASRRRLDQAGFSPRLGNGEQESGGAREQGSMGAGEHGSRGVGEQGSRGAGGQGSRGAFTSAPQLRKHLCTEAAWTDTDESGIPLDKRIEPGGMK